MVIRPIDRLDAREVAAAASVVVAGYRALPGDQLSDGYAAQLAAVGRRAADAEVVVAVAPEVQAITPGILGCVTFVPDHTNPWAEGLSPGECGIRMLAVDPDAWGQGVGRALLAHCLARGQALGRAGCFLHSTPVMAAAHHLYTAAGFARVPERDWWPSEDVELWGFRLVLPEQHPTRWGTRPAGAPGPTWHPS